jgi:hypothetical protein
MITKDRRYISLLDPVDSGNRDNWTELMPESRVVELSGKGWGWVWNRPTGVVLQRGKDHRRYPIFDFTRALQLLFYGISLVFIAVGVSVFLNKEKGDQDGGEE